MPIIGGEFKQKRLTVTVSIDNSSDPEDEDYDPLAFSRIKNLGKAIGDLQSSTRDMVVLSVGENRINDVHGLLTPYCEKHGAVVDIRDSVVSV